MNKHEEARKALLSNTCEIDNSEKLLLDYIKQFEDIENDVKDFMKLLKRYHANNVPLSKEAKEKYVNLFAKLSKVGEDK